MSNPLNSIGVRSAAAAQPAPAIRVETLDYDQINRAFSQGWADGMRIKKDLADLEDRKIERQNAQEDRARAQAVAAGKQPAVVENGGWFVDSLTGRPIQRKAAPREDSIIVQKNGAYIQQRYSTDPYTLERKLLDEVEIMPANPAASGGVSAASPAAEGPALDSEPDPLDFSSEQPAAPSEAPSAAPIYGVRSVGQKGLVLGVQRPRATSTEASGAGGDSYAKQADNDYLKDAAEAATTAQKVLPKLQTFAQLNGETASGPLVGAKPVAWVRSLFDNDVATLNALTNDFAKLAREGFPGSVSNAEMNLFRSAGPSISNPGKTNATLVSVMMPIYQRGAEKYGMAREWVARNKSLDGFDSLWNQYINEVPTVPKAVLDRASSGKKEDVSAALDMLANTPAQPRVGFRDFVALKRFGRVPAADVQTLSSKGAAVLVGADGKPKSPELLRQEVEQSIRAKYPSAPSSEENSRAAANYDAATEAILEGASRVGLNSAVDAAVQPTPAPTLVKPQGGKTVGDVMNLDINPKRETKSLPALHPTQTLPDGREVTMIDDPATAEAPLPERASSAGYGGNYEEYAGIPAPFKRTKGNLLGRVVESVGGPEAPGKVNSGEVSDKFVSFLQENRTKIASDPKFRAKVNFVIRDSVAAYDPERTNAPGQRHFERPPVRLNADKTLQRRARLQAALLSARLNGLVRLPALPSEPTPASISAGVDDIQVTAAR